MGFEEVRAELVSLSGIADKVASCIMLYSLGFDESFPIDRWIKRVMQENYFGGKDVPNKQITQYASKYFGRDAGYAQQFLFNYRRLHA